MGAIVYGVLEVFPVSFPGLVSLRYHLTNEDGHRLCRHGSIGPEPWKRLRKRLVMDSTELDTYEAALRAGSHHVDLGVRQFRMSSRTATFR